MGKGLVICMLGDTRTRVAHTNTPYSNSPEGLVMFSWQWARLPAPLIIGNPYRGDFQLTSRCFSRAELICFHPDSTC